MRPPNVAFWVCVAFREVFFDRFDQFADAPEASLSDAIAGQVGEEPLHQVHPRTAGRREVHSEPGMFLQPCCQAGVLVRGVVVGDHVNRQVGRRFGFYLLQKSQSLHVRVGGLGSRDQFAFQVIERREQCNGAVTLVVVGPDRIWPIPSGNPGCILSSA